MKLLNDFLDTIGTDKALHYLVGALTVSYMSFFGWLWIILGSAGIIFLNCIKERYLDEISDIKDIMFTAYGCLTSALVYLLFTLVF